MIVWLPASRLRADTVHFNRDVRPPLQHTVTSVMADEAESGLRLDLAKESLTRLVKCSFMKISAGNVWVRQIRRKVPPPDPANQVSAAEIAVRKVDQAGARHETHWAYVSPGG